MLSLTWLNHKIAHKAHDLIESIGPGGAHLRMGI